MADNISASRVIDAAADAIFAVLADPANHAAIDGTGWVRDDLDGRLITTSGQVFQIAMYHPNHPDGDYEMANRVEVFDPPNAIAWQPGQYRDGELSFGGWIWRYDLSPSSTESTEVRLTYDWSAVPDSIREYIQFPPFPMAHLENSLAHLGELAQP